MREIPELFQFRFSHFNEKMRWTLDYKGISHYRRSLLPGAHIPVALWHSRQKQTPFLRDGTRVIAGSAAIIEHLEQEQPRISLYPRGLKERNRALELQQWLDNDIGPAVRRAFFHDLFTDRAYTARCFTLGASTTAQHAYRLMMPGLMPILRADMRITAKGAEQGRAATTRALDFIAETAGTDGYLVADRFTVADLTAAALLMITVFPAQLPFQMPEPWSEGMQTWINRWAAHPALAWIHNTYRRHRGHSAAVNE